MLLYKLGRKYSELLFIPCKINYSAALSSLGRLSIVNVSGAIHMHPGGGYRDLILGRRCTQH